MNGERYLPFPEEAPEGWPLEYVAAADYEELSARCEELERYRQQGLDIVSAQALRIDLLEKALNPRRWDTALSDAWHKNIPDVMLAFQKLKEAALSPPDADPGCQS